MPSKLIDNTPHMVRLFNSLPVCGDDLQKFWDAAESIMAHEIGISISIINIMRDNNSCYGNALYFLEEAVSFCRDGSHSHNKYSATACVAIAFAIANLKVPLSI